MKANPPALENTGLAGCLFWRKYMKSTQNVLNKTLELLSNLFLLIWVQVRICFQSGFNVFMSKPFANQDR